MSINRRLFMALVTVAAASPALAFEHPRKGRIETLAKFGLEGDEPRIRVWLPPSYSRICQPHRTLYMLDGQFAFAEDSDGVNFAADSRIARLIAEQTVAPTLIVAIDNLEDGRFLQFMPQTIYDRAGPDVRAVVEREIERVGKTALVSQQFIAFLQIRLKPFIDANYNTSPARLDTAIFGASMAGVMSGAIFVEAQDTFGLGACMSPNWAIYDERMIDFPELPGLWADYFAQLGAPQGRRLWLDHGTEMMDAGMAPHQTAIAQRLSDLRWRDGCNLQTQVYEAGHAFAETAVQMDDVLAWLLG